MLRAIDGPGYAEGAKLFARVEFWKNYEEGSGWKERRELSFTLLGNIGDTGIPAASNGLFYSAGRILTDPGPSLSPSVENTFPTEATGTEQPEIYVQGGTGAVILRPVMFSLPAGITRIQFELTAWEETGGGSPVDYIFAACVA